MGRKKYFLIKETNWFKTFGKGKKIGPWILPYMIVTSNVAVRKKEVLKVDSFNEKFKTWGYEDVHFGAKLIAAGNYIIPSKKSKCWMIVPKKRKNIFSNKNEVIYKKLINNTL